MKYLVTSYKDNAEKQEIESKGLYCYDLRHSDEGGEIATIEKSVLVNRIGSIITDEELKFDSQNKYDNFIDFQEFSSKNTQVDIIEELQDTPKEKVNENSHKIINGYSIYKEGTWCEVTKNGHHVFDGNVEENMTPEQIYQEVMKEVVFSIKGKEILSYDFINEFKGERESTIKSLAEENKCNEKDIEVTVRKPKLKEKNLGQQKQNVIQKSKILKTNNREYPYNVQIWNSLDGGKNFCYTGNGKFCKTKIEADSYAKQLEKQGIKREKVREREAR